MNKLTTLDWITLLLVIVGGINWGLVGIFDYNLVTSIFGDGATLSRIVFSLVGLSALYLVFVVGSWSRKA